MLEGSLKERQREELGSFEVERMGDREEKKGLKENKEDERGGKERMASAEETMDVR